MPKLPHIELYSFILTMLWLSLSSSLSLAKYFYQYASTTVAVVGGFPETHIEAQRRINSTWQRLLGQSHACILVEIFGKDNEEERDNHSIVSMNEYISL